MSRINLLSSTINNRFIRPSEMISDRWLGYSHLSMGNGLIEADVRQRSVSS
jgi:hypothetical protein